MYVLICLQDERYEIDVNYIEKRPKNNNRSEVLSSGGGIYRTKKGKKHFAFVNLFYYSHLLSLIWSGDYDVSMNKNKGVFFSSTTSTTESSLMRKSEKPGLQFSRQEGGRVNGMRILNHQNRLDDHLSSDVSGFQFLKPPR